SVADKHSVETIRKLLEAAKPRQFKESVELAVNLRDIDLSVPKNRVDEEVVLPKGRGKPIRICVFASGEPALKARNVADLVIQPAYVETTMGPAVKYLYGDLDGPRRSGQETARGGSCLSMRQGAGSRDREHPRDPRTAVPGDPQETLGPRDDYGRKEQSASAR